MDDGKFLIVSEIKQIIHMIDNKPVANNQKLLEYLVCGMVDEPFASTSIYAQWCVFEEAKKNNLKVMLDGQGADKQLADYGGFYGIMLEYYLKRFQFIKFCKEANNYAKIYSTGNRKKFLESRVKAAIKRTCTPNKLYIRKLKKKGYNHLPFTQTTKEKVYQGRNISLIKNEKIYYRQHAF